MLAELLTKHHVKNPLFNQVNYPEAMAIRSGGNVPRRDECFFDDLGDSSWEVLLKMFKKVSTYELQGKYGKYIYNTLELGKKKPLKNIWEVSQVLAK